MLYLSIDTNRISLLYLKKSLFGQYESSVFSKEYQTSLLEKGKIVTVDFMASALKEALNALPQTALKDKNVFLILPQESYSFFRIEVPTDIAPSAIDSFVRDKARANFPNDLEEYTYDYIVEENAKEKYIHVFAIENDIRSKSQESVQLLELKLTAVLPEALSYFTLFRKTLRKDKKENIFFVTYSKKNLMGLLYDSYGLSSEEKWLVQIDQESKVEQILKEKVDEYESKGIKLNRLILAGESSQNVRQDTFTKAIGVWTNPLKRIIPEFYKEYVKLLVTSTTKQFSFLSYEACVGAFIFSQENKRFSLLKNELKEKKKFSLAVPKLHLPLKEISLFVFSFIVSFLLLLLLSKMNFKFNLPKGVPQLFAKTTPTPTPIPILKPSPSPAVEKEEIKIKILNGSGTRGKASEVSDILKEKGYQEILTDNADNFDYETSELQVKKSMSQVKSPFKQDLKEYVTSFKESTLNEDEAADIVIIIGSDFK